MSTSRVESEGPGPRLQTSLLTAVDSDHRQQRQQDNQDCPTTRTLCTSVWRVSGHTHTHTKYYKKTPHLQQIKKNHQKFYSDLFIGIHWLERQIYYSFECKWMSLSLLCRLLSGLSPIRGLRAVVRETGGHQLLEVGKTERSILCKIHIWAFWQTVVYGCCCSDMGPPRPQEMHQPDRSQQTRQSVRRQ